MTVFTSTDNMSSMPDSYPVCPKFSCVFAEPYEKKTGKHTVSEHIRCLNPLFAEEKGMPDCLQNECAYNGSCYICAAGRCDDKGKYMIRTRVEEECNA